MITRGEFHSKLRHSSRVLVLNIWSRHTVSTASRRSPSRRKSSTSTCSNLLTRPGALCTQLRKRATWSTFSSKTHFWWIGTKTRTPTLSFYFWCASALTRLLFLTVMHINWRKFVTLDNCSLCTSKGSISHSLLRRSTMFLLSRRNCREIYVKMLLSALLLGVHMISLMRDALFSRNY